MQEQYTVSQVLCQELEKRVQFVFGMPGGGSVPLLEAIRQSSMDFVLIRHEASAGFMADAVFQRTGQLGVCLSTLGPGATNLLSGVAQAYLERSTILAIVGQIDAHLQPIYTHQILDQKSMFEPVCHEYVQLHPHRTEVQLRRLFRQLDQDVGPIVLELTLQSSNYACLSIQPENVIAPTFASSEAALKLLQEAQFPVLFVGAEDLSEEVSIAITHLSNQLNIPVLTTYRAKGIVSENEHSWSLGAAGLSPVVDEVQQQFLAQSDLIICVGLDPVELRPNWLPGWSDSTKVLCIQSGKQQDLVAHCDVIMQGSILSAVESLTRSTTELSAYKWSLLNIETHQQQLQQIFQPLKDSPFNPAKMVRAIQKNAHKDTVLCLDVGAHRICATHVWQCERPRMLLQSNGFSSMGVGLPMAIAVCLMEPKSPVITLCGDMGLWMSIGELGIVQERGLNLTVVFFADRTLSLIELKQERQQPHCDNYGVRFANPDTLSIAKSFGGTGWVCQNEDELAIAIQSSQSQQGLHIIEVWIDENCYREQM